MKKKMVTFMLGMMMCASIVLNSGVSASAQTLVDSTASSADDETAGKDVTQGVSTQYATPDTIKSTTYNGNESTTVYATKSSRVTLTVPKVLVVGETEEETTYAGSFNVKVKGDIAGSQSITVTPVVEESLQEVGGKTSQTSTIIMLDGKPSYTLTANDLLNGKQAVIQGGIVIENVTSGVWKGGISFNIELDNDELSAN